MRRFLALACSIARVTSAALMIPHSTRISPSFFWCRAMVGRPVFSYGGGGKAASNAVDSLVGPTVCGARTQRGNRHLAGATCERTPLDPDHSLCAAGHRSYLVPSSPRWGSSERRDESRQTAARGAIGRNLMEGRSFRTSQFTV